MANAKNYAKNHPEVQFQSENQSQNLRNRPEVDRRQQSCEYPSVTLLIRRSPKRDAPNERDLSRTLHLIKCREMDKKPSVALMRHESEPNPACDATKSISKPAFVAQRSSDAQSNRPVIAHLSIYWPRVPQIAQKRHAFAPDNADGHTRPNANRGRRRVHDNALRSQDANVNAPPSPVRVPSGQLLEEPCNPDGDALANEAY